MSQNKEAIILEIPKYKQNKWPSKRPQHDENVITA